MTARTAALYCRISRDKAGAGLGVERQEEDCKRLAAQLGWAVGGIYIDNDVSASSGRRRPEYERMLADIDRGAVDAVISWHPDRLHRRPAELEQFITLCDQHAVEIRTVQAGAMDLSTPSGRLVARMLGAAARHEIEHKSERIRRARVQLAQQGKYGGGRRAFGWESDGLTQRADEAELIRYAASQVLAGVSLRQVVGEFNRRQIPTASGSGRWVGAKLRSILLSPRNAGLAALNGEILGEATWEPIIDRDKFYALQAILNDPDRRWPRGGSAAAWLGSGIYRCGVCGSNSLRVNPTASGRRRYRCYAPRADGDRTRHVGRDQERVDEFVTRVLLARLSMEDAAPLFAAPDRGGVDTNALAGELSQLEDRLNDLADLYGRGGITAAQLESGTASIRQRQDEVTAALAAAAETNPVAALAGADDIEERWRSLSLGVQREILKSLVTVTILPTKPGRKGDGGYFDYDAIHFEWRTR
ncbi:hypothetical protein ACN93_03830 [Gordonia paraffinivorans]|uniref:recombinase family protein n=1 Tax=Gordonia paraffinivorans TaxID=175628 RepID=UPI000D60375E|nr:recombinase family protein [Gordonia paraffinivorans]PWD44543.1 hypothetical protein ACN93_03830 [Gordonia paraffinivorans]